MSHKPATGAATEQGNLPPDAVTIAELLDSMVSKYINCSLMHMPFSETVNCNGLLQGVRDYEPRVIQQLLDCMYRHVSDILQDAEVTCKGNLQLLLEKPQAAFFLF